VWCFCGQLRFKSKIRISAFILSGLHSSLGINCELVAHCTTHLTLRFPGGGPGIGKAEPKTKKPRNASAPKAAAAKSKRPPKATSNGSRRIVTDLYLSQVTLADFVESLVWFQYFGLNTFLMKVTSCCLFLFLSCSVHT
jgi:hypothetical protein